jgi:lysophospholipase L1-like esterase
VNTRGRFLSGLATIIMALAGFVTAGALPAAATPGTDVPYVALGDSYAAGTAIGSFPNCPLGDDRYPKLLADSESRIVLTATAACSGWKTSDVASYVADPLRSALDRDTTRLVTLTVGAANLGLSDVARACLGPDQVACGLAIAKAQGVLGDCKGESPLGELLIHLYGEVAKAAPSARIVVTGYPLLFEPPADNDRDRDAKTAINNATTRLNCVIERAVAAANDADVNIHYVDVTEGFARHGIVDPRSCTDASDFIHRLSLLPTCDPRPDPEAFHPTPAGYQAYADAISAALPGGWTDKPRGSA